MIYGIGNAFDLYMIESAAQMALKGASSYPDHYSFGEECFRSSEGFSFGGQSVPFDETEKRYMRLVGLMYGAGQERFASFIRILGDRTGILSDEGRKFINNVLAGAAAGRIEGACPFICDIIMQAQDSSPEAHKLLPGTHVHEAPVYIQ